MFGFQAATCLPFLGCAKRSHTQSEAQPRTEEQEEGEERMQGGTKEYQLKWTTDPKTWKHSGDSQAGYHHGSLSPQEVRKILENFDDDKEKPDILLRDLNWRAMVKRAVKYPIEEWKLGKEPNTSFDGRQVVDDLQRAGIRIEVMHIKANNTYGAWLMDAIWTEMWCAINISREDGEYVAVPNEAYKAIPVTWPEGSGLEGWNDENTGNIWEAWAGTLWLRHQKEGVNSIRRLIVCALMTGGDTKIPLSKHLMENGREEWVDTDTKTKIQHLRSWNPAKKRTRVVTATKTMDTIHN